jgi:hypothetical protein
MTLIELAGATISLQEPVNIILFFYFITAILSGNSVFYLLRRFNRYTPTITSFGNTQQLKDYFLFRRSSYGPAEYVLTSHNYLNECAYKLISHQLLINA